MSEEKVKDPVLAIINDAISTAIAIINESKEEHIQEMAAKIADRLIALTNVPDF